MTRSLASIALCLTILVLAAFVPTVAAQPVPVEKCSRECDPMSVNDNRQKTGKEVVNMIIYGHFRTLLDMAPLNTQPPDPQFEPDVNKGFLMPVLDTNSGACLPNTQTCGDFHFKGNEFVMFSSPGFVSYLSDGSWYTHQEPGLAGDAKIVGDEIRLYWYMSAHGVSGHDSGSGPGATAPVGVMPQVGVYARMETGRFEFRGETIAESADFDENAPGSDERATMVTVPGQPDVYEFQVKMRVLKDTIPNSHLANGFIVYVNPYQVKTDKEYGVQVMQEQWRLRTGANYPPRLVIPIEEPMKTVSSTMSIFEDRLFLRWSFISVWGSYDMRDAQLSLKSTGPNNIDQKAIDFIILKRSVDHDGHFKPVNATWAIDFTNFELPDGDYELTASIPSYQETYLLEEKFAFKVVNGRPDVYEIGRPGPGPGDPRPDPDVPKSPGVGFAAVLAALLVLAVRLRRRS